jgi:hypothetical protein
MDWRKSSYSGANGGSCVETASGDGTVLVRDTTDRDGGTLAFTANAWRAFMADMKRRAAPEPPRTTQDAQAGSPRGRKKPAGAPHRAQRGVQVQVQPPARSSARIRATSGRVHLHSRSLRVMISLRQR